MSSYDFINLSQATYPPNLTSLLSSISQFHVVFLPRAHETSKSIIRSIIGSLSYSSGQILESGAETVKTVGGATLSVGTDVLDDMADLLKGQPGTDKIAPITEPRPTPPENPVQGTQTQWCLVGEYQGQRSCLETTDNEKCLSGQLFTDRNKCINPALTKQM